MNRIHISKTVALALAFAAVTAAPPSLKAQSDGFISNGAEIRDGYGGTWNGMSGGGGNGGSWNGMNGGGNGGSWNDMNGDGGGASWNGMEDETPLGGGLLILAASGVCYAAAKNRKNSNIQ